MTIDLGLAAPCGIYCGDCEHLKKRCSGCCSVAGKPFWAFEIRRLEVCPLYGCCVVDKGLEHCGLCEKIPCEMFEASNSPLRTPEEAAQTVLARKRALLRRKEVGTGRWLDKRKG